MYQIFILVIYMQIKISVYFQTAVSPDQSGDIVLKVRTLVYKIFLKPTSNPLYITLVGFTPFLFSFLF